jgi:mannosylglucosylglycerate synthase
LREADPFILLPVRITRRKNIEYAIRVVGELRLLGWRPTLLVTGPRGPHDPSSTRYVRELQALVDELGLEREVALLQTRPAPSGRTWKPTDTMMDELYRVADLMLFPSAQEGFGIPLVEAGAVNLPVFCSDIPAFREIAGGQAEFFALEDEPSTVAARIDRFMRDDARYVLRRRVRHAYDWDAIFDHLLLPLLRSAAEPTGEVDRGNLARSGAR